MENIFYVYLHRRKTDNKVFYVGKGKGKRAYSKHGRSDWWKRTVEKHGFVVEVVFSALSEEDAFQCEKDTILEFRYFDHPLVNLTDGGEGTSGHKPSAETIAKRTKQTTGKKRTPEQCKRISESLKGRKLSPSVVEGMIKRRTGVKRTAESIQKTSNSNRGKKRSAEFLDKVSGLKHYAADLNLYTFKERTTGEIFIGTRFDFAAYSGIKSTNINNLFLKTKPAKTVFNWTIIKEDNDTKTEEKTEEY